MILEVARLLLYCLLLLFVFISSLTLEATCSATNFPCIAATDAMVTNVNVANNWARSTHGNFDDSVDQNVFDTTTASVISDPSNIFTEVRIVGSIDRAESEWMDSCGWGKA